jgi:hypothetical protein
MARFAIGAAAFIALCHADDKASVPPGTYGHDGLGDLTTVFRSS